MLRGGAAMIAVAGLVASNALHAASPRDPPHVTFCDLVAEPQHHAGKIVTTGEVIETGTLDNGAMLLVDPSCKGRQHIVAEAAAPGSIDKLHAYRVPEAVQMKGAFWFWVVVKGQLARRAPTTAYGAEDDGWHFMITSVERIEARPAD